MTRQSCRGRRGTGSCSLSGQPSSLALLTCERMVFRIESQQLICTQNTGRFDLVGRVLELQAIEPGELARHVVLAIHGYLYAVVRPFVRYHRTERDCIDRADPVHGGDGALRPRAVDGAPHRRQAHSRHGRRRRHEHVVRHRFRPCSSQAASALPRPGQLLLRRRIWSRRCACCLSLGGNRKCAEAMRRRTVGRLDFRYDRLEVGIRAPSASLARLDHPVLCPRVLPHAWSRPNKERDGQKNRLRRCHLSHTCRESQLTTAQ